jgi:hypothetical protein
MGLALRVFVRIAGICHNDSSIWRTDQLKQPLIKTDLCVVRQAHHERNRYFTVHTAIVEGPNQVFPKAVVP